MNESKRRSENRSRLLEIQNLSGLKLCIPSRLILSETELVKIKKGKARKPLTCVIMNDSILLMKKSGDVSLFADLETVKLVRPPPFLVVI